MNLPEYLQNHTLITDGAMGTYYTEITGDTGGFSELANLEHPEIIRRIHGDYIRAGARLIRTNTFSANTLTLNRPRPQVEQLIVKGYEIARQAVNGQPVYIAANIGPVPEPSAAITAPSTVVLAEYRWIIDTFLAAGATVFNFETFSNLDYLPEICAHLKTQQPNCYILAQFAITPDGCTRKGVDVAQIISQVKQMAVIDAYGFNCGAGPGHLYRILQQYDFSGKPVAVLPNAGFPEVINERTFYVQNPAYFAERVNNFKALGFRILGGCCGTNPAHIQALAVQEAPVVMQPAVTGVTPGNPPANPVPAPNRFAEKLRQGQFIVAAELDPPFDASTDKIMDRARIYQTAGVDIITIADSPLAKPRADSVTIAAKIMRELNIETLPHLCCRDRNGNALKSAVLAAHIEGIRNILAVTGDPLPRATQNEIKSVFNLNSLELISLLTAMNRSTFETAPLTIGGALNLNVRNRQLEIERMLKKVDKGATFFLTQPLFNREAIEFLPQIAKPDGVRIIAGILPVVTHANALFLQNEVPGMTLPDEFVNRFHPGMERDTAEQVGISLAAEIAAEIRPYVDGFYFITPFNRAAMVVAIMKQLGLVSG